MYPFRAPASESRHSAHGPARCTHNSLTPNHAHILTEVKRAGRGPLTRAIPTVTAQNYLGDLVIAVIAGIVTELVKHQLDKPKGHDDHEPDDGDDPTVEQDE
jgi:hypothetical protein